MSYIDVGMSGWYKTSMIFKVSEKLTKGDIEVFKCRDINGNIFYIEDSEMFSKYSKHSSTFKTTVEESLTNVVEKLQNTREIFEIKFNKVDGESRILRGYTINSKSKLGYTLVYDLDSKGERNLNNRHIEYLILNSTKYLVK